MNNTARTKNILNKLGSWGKKYFQHFLLAQLVASGLSLPVLVCWGLPISIMTFVGNFFFTPILTVFLGACSMLFFTELLGIPNTWVANGTGWLVDAWHACLSFGKLTWLLGFAQPHPVVICLLSAGLVGTLLWTIHKPIGKKIQGLAAFNGCTITLLLILTLLTPGQPVLDQFKHLKIKKIAPGLVKITDDGFFKRILSPEKTVAYKLKPYLIKQLGSVTVDTLTTTTCSYRSLVGLLACCQELPVRTIILPYFTESLTKAGWRAFFRLKRHAQAKNIKVVRRRLGEPLERTAVTHGEQRQTRRQPAPMENLAPLAP